MEIFAFLIAVAAFFWFFILPLIILLSLKSLREEQRDNFQRIREHLEKLLRNTPVHPTQTPQSAPHRTPTATTSEVESTTATPTSAEQVSRPLPETIEYPQQKIAAEHIPAAAEPEIIGAEIVSQPEPPDTSDSKTTPPLVDHYKSPNQPQEQYQKAWQSSPNYYPAEQVNSSAREPSAFEKAAKETLSKIWSWIIVGEEHIPKGVSTEFAVASQWLLRIGIIILVVGIGFFLKYSIDRGLLVPEARVILTVIAGLSMLIGGTQLLGRKYHILGQGLMGGGFAALYFAVFAAYQYFHMLEPTPAFVLMAVITALAGGVAVRFNSMLVAVLGIIGGYGTPLMLASETANYPALFGYMLVLGCGVLAIGIYRNWPLVNYLSFIANYALFTATMSDYNQTMFWDFMPFLIGFFVLFSTMSFLNRQVHQTTTHLLDLLSLLLNVAFFFGVSYRMVDELYGRKWISVVTIGLTIYYSLHFAVLANRKFIDRNLLAIFFGLASCFLATTMPLVLTREWITASWSLEALMLLWMALQLRSGVVRFMAYILFALVILRFGFLDLSRTFFGQGWTTTAALTWSDYSLMLLSRIVSFGVPIASMLLAYRWILNLSPEETVDADGNQTRPLEHRLLFGLKDHWIIHCLLAAALGLGLVYLHLELSRSVGYAYAPARDPILTLLWLTFCGVVIYLWTRAEHAIVMGLGIALTVLVIGKVLLFDVVRGWGITDNLLYSGAYYSYRDAAMRFIDFAAVIGFLTAVYALLVARQSAIAPRRFFAVASLVMLFIYSSLEVNSFLFHFYPGFRYGGVSILWATFALGMLLRGIGRNNRNLRYAGLILFAVVSFKVFFVDLRQLDPIYRIIAFVILGLLLLAGSFVYLKHRERFAISDESNEGKS